MPAEPRPATTIEILLVEDNPADVRLVREALNQGAGICSVTAVSDGEAALEHLSGSRGPGEGLPDLVLLDLNLPGTSGREVLSEIKGDADLRHIPVIVPSSSGAAEDISTAYGLHANAYVSKPLGFDELVAALRSLASFWLSVARLPGPSGVGGRSGS
jgi:CheY-like chemotaxis protein